MCLCVFIHIRLIYANRCASVWCHVSNTQSKCTYIVPIHTCLTPRTSLYEYLSRVYLGQTIFCGQRSGREHDDGLKLVVHFFYIHSNDRCIYSQAACRGQSSAIAKFVSRERRSFFVWIGQPHQIALVPNDVAAAMMIMMIVVLVRRATRGRMDRERKRAQWSRFNSLPLAPLPGWPTLFGRPHSAVQLRKQ